MEKELYRFVSRSEAEVGGFKLDRFGQRLEIEPERATVFQRGGAALLPESVFMEFGFSPEELKVFSSPFFPIDDMSGEQAEEKAAYLEKVRKAQERYVAIRNELLNPAPVTEFNEFNPAPATEEEQ